jgi:glycosyltransferase involved in cell wall biosynthesis
LIQAFLQVHRANPDTSLVLVGHMSREITHYLNQIAQEGASIYPLGYVHDAILHHLYVRAQAVVYPSLYEGFGLPALEALAHQTPVITSNTSSLPEVVGQAGYQVDPTDVDALVSAMTDVLQPDSEQDWPEVALGQVSKFSWESTAVSTYHAYEQVLTSSARPLRLSVVRTP